MTTNVTQDQLEALRAAYVRTGSVTEAAKEADVPRTGAYYHLETMGFSFDRTPPLKELAELHGQGWSYAKMAAHFRVSGGTIHNWMVKAGMTVPGRRKAKATA